MVWHETPGRKASEDDRILFLYKLRAFELLGTKGTQGSGDVVSRVIGTLTGVVRNCSYGYTYSSSC